MTADPKALVHIFHAPGGQLYSRAPEEITMNESLAGNGVAIHKGRLYVLGFQIATDTHLKCRSDPPAAPQTSEPGVLREPDEGEDTIDSTCFAPSVPLLLFLQQTSG